jgi:hypothetical protein
MAVKIKSQARCRSMAVIQRLKCRRAEVMGETWKGSEI